jgi:small-conductance mechanosensitive channel
MKLEEFEAKDAYNLVVNKLENWLETLIAMLPNLALAILILIISYFVGRIVKNAVGRMLGRISKNVSLIHLIENIIYVTVIIIGSFIALDVLELEKQSLRY